MAVTFFASLLKPHTVIKVSRLSTGRGVGLLLVLGL